MICDVAKWQGKIDWDKLAPAIEDGYVAIKASGKYANGADPQYARNVEGAVAHGVPFHVFHFLYCLTEAEAKRDAGLFYRTVQAAGHWPLFWVLDCEGGWGIAAKKARPVAEAFEAELRRLARESGPGEIRVAVYIGQNRYYDYALDYGRYAYVWIPGYGEKYRPKMPCDVWQYTDKVRLPGISGDVDLNMLIGDKPMEYFTSKSKEGENMAKLMPIKRFVAELEAALKRKDGYIMGAYGQNPRTGYLDLSVPESKCKAAWLPTGYYYKQYLDKDKYSTDKQYKQALKWRKNCTRVWDCNGMAEGIYEIFSGVCINSKARYNYAQWCNPKGSGMIPTERRVPGAAVFWSDKPEKKPTAGNIHHVAYLWKPVKEGHPEGDWWIIEAKGVMYGVVKSKLYSRKPNFWGLMTKYYDYSGEPAPEPTPTPKLGDRDLRKGDKGEDVRELQRDLMKLGYPLKKYGADGDFGGETEKAVRTFQLDHGLLADGVMQKDDFDALFKALEGDTPQPVAKVEITGESVNVRSAPNTSGRVLGVVHKGDKLPYMGEDSANGWHRVEYKNGEGWVSPKYSRVVGE